MSAGVRKAITEWACDECDGRILEGTEYVLITQTATPRYRTLCMGCGRPHLGLPRGTPAAELQRADEQLTFGDDRGE